MPAGTTHTRRRAPRSSWRHCAARTGGAGRAARCSGAPGRERARSNRGGGWSTKLPLSTRTGRATSPCPPSTRRRRGTPRRGTAPRGAARGRRASRCPSTTSARPWRPPPAGPDAPAPPERQPHHGDDAHHVEEGDPERRAVAEAEHPHPRRERLELERARMAGGVAVVRGGRPGAEQRGVPGEDVPGAERGIRAVPGRDLTRLGRRAPLRRRRAAWPRSPSAQQHPAQDRRPVLRPPARRSTVALTIAGPVAGRTNICSHVQSSSDRHARSERRVGRRGAQNGDPRHRRGAVRVVGAAHVAEGDRRRLRHPAGQPLPPLRVEGSDHRRAGRALPRRPRRHRRARRSPPLDTDAEAGGRPDRGAGLGDRGVRRPAPRRAAAHALRAAVGRQRPAGAACRSGRRWRSSRRCSRRCAPAEASGDIRARDRPRDAGRPAVPGAAARQPGRVPRRPRRRRGAGDPVPDLARRRRGRSADRRGARPLGRRSRRRQRTIDEWDKADDDEDERLPDAASRRPRASSVGAGYEATTVATSPRPPG